MQGTHHAPSGLALANTDASRRSKGESYGRVVKWGPALNERQWGTVREGYRETGDAWGYLSHDQVRSRAYRWGEDGIAGICDDEQESVRVARPDSES